MGLGVLSTVLLSVYSVAAIANTDVSVAVQEVVPSAEEIYLSQLDAMLGQEFIQASAEPGGVVMPRPARTSEPGHQLSIAELNDIVTLGEKVVHLINEGRPQTTFQRQTVAVIPSAMSDWTALAGWNPKPAFKVFEVNVYSNTCSVLAGARLKISALYGGNYQGNGKFLSNVTLIPTLVENRAFASGFDLWTEFRDAVNIGSYANPVGAVGMDVRFRFKNWMADIAGTYDAMVTGYGQISMDTTAAGLTTGRCAKK